MRVGSTTSPKTERTLYRLEEYDTRLNLSVSSKEQMSTAGMWVGLGSYTCNKGASL